MALTAGTRLGPYEVLALLGAGGMGEVYRARDTKLGRDVAVKILSSAVIGDIDRLARFEREAHMLAALNHPHIAAIYGIEEAQVEGGISIRALVLELVEGETLADRIKMGRLRLPDALNLARQIAHALDAAHEKGIIHRDLKPANIKITPEGVAKVLDFGLAKAAPGSRDEADPSRAVTATVDGTREGLVRGTPGYMSPEQARGLAVDKRTDIWSYGCVLYAMLTGRVAFPGSTVSDALAATLEREPDWSALPADTPAGVWRLLRKCLEKDLSQRLRDIGDARIVLEGGPKDEASGARLSAPTTWRRAWIGTTIVALAAIATVAALVRRPAPATFPTLRLSVVAPPGATFTPIDISGAPQFVLSPDGSQLAFVASLPGESSRLWIRSLETGAVQPLQGTEDAAVAFWAPDSKNVAFFARRKLKRVSIGGGPPQDLSDVAHDVTSGAWSPNGIIVFGGATGDGLFRISADGGSVTTATTLDPTRGETGHRWPQFLPDSRRFIFHVRSTKPENSGVYLASIDSVSKVQVLSSAANAVYSDPGYLLFEQAGNLMAQDFNAQAGKLAGQAFSLGIPISVLVGPSYLPLSVGSTGTMAYWEGRRPPSSLEWFDRSGRILGQVGAPDSYRGPALSPHTDKLLFAVADGLGLRTIDLSTSLTSRLTFTPGIAQYAVWSPDGREVIFSSSTNGVPRLYRKMASGAGPDTLVLSPPTFAAFPTDWSRDGRWLFYDVTAKTGWDIWALNLADGKSAAVVEKASNEVQGRLSPNGQWLAYTSDVSGAWEVHVRPHGTGQGEWQVSSGGGSQPLWRDDGKELFYIAADGRLVAVSVGASSTFEAVAKQLLFETRTQGMLAPFRLNYAVSPDGQRFLVNNIVPGAVPQTISLVLNWRSGIGRTQAR